MDVKKKPLSVGLVRATARAEKCPFAVGLMARRAFRVLHNGIRVAIMLYVNEEGVVVEAGPASIHPETASEIAFMRLGFSK
nr:hypothetical protein [Tanacetum cinerariifolium]